MLSPEALAGIIAAVAALLSALGIKAWNTGKKSNADVQPLLDYKTASRFHVEVRGDVQAVRLQQEKAMEELRRELRELRDKLVEIETALRYIKGG